MSFETFVEAVMQIKPSRVQHAMRPQDLGKKIHTVKHPYSGCPFCFAVESTMNVHEYGVQWPCGCSRAIDPIHRTPDEFYRCKRCNPVVENNVIPLRRSA